ncbi:Hsp70 family protein [Mycobacterium sp. MBM]|nr:Hsp70 family protein [Mycobacterium sp. MBM]
MGLSIGATNLTAVAVGRTSLTRPARLGPPGRELTDVVDRVGDPIAILAPDGTSHRPEMLLIEALRALLHGVGGAAQLAVTHPVHRRPAAVDALRAALASVPELAGAVLIDDAGAAATALADRPGLPARGAIVVCDFGGSGTSITFVDAANGYRPVGPAVRHAELSGALLDQALLRRVLADLPDSAAGESGTSALGSLARLREQCRAAKERLSDEVATALQVDLPTYRAEVRLTRDEVDAQLRAPLGDFLAVVRDAMQHNGIRARDLTAAATVGGGARIPVITTTLSEHLGIPVITSPHPALSAAIGGGLIAAARADDTATAVAAVAAEVPVTQAPAAPAQLAWSQDAGAIAEPVPYAGPVHDPRPEIRFSAEEVPEFVAAEDVPWYRRAHVMIGLGAAVVLVAAVLAVILVQRADERYSPTIDSTTVSSTAVTSAPDAPPQVPVQTATVAPQAPADRTPAPATEAPPPASPPPPPAAETPAPTTEPPTTAAPAEPPVIPTLPAIPPIPTIPGLPPFIPQPGQLISP